LSCRNFDDSENSQFDEWDEVFIADADAEAAEEVSRWVEEQPFYGDLEQAAILAFFNVQRFRRLEEEELEYINDARSEHAIEISLQRAGGHGEAGRLPMELKQI
jgi:hypothetical protein